MVKTSNISLEDWAVLFGHLQHFPKEQRDEVIERLGLDPAELDRLEKEGNAALFAAMDSGDMASVEGFGQRVSETKKKLRAEGKKVEDLGPRRKVKTGPMKAKASRAPAPPKASRAPAPPKASRAPAPPRSPRSSAPPKASRVPAAPKASRTPAPPKSVRRPPVIPAAPPEFASAPAMPARSHPWLSLHQYACLRAETANASGDEAVAIIRARYGLDEATDSDEVAAWCVRFKDRDAFEQYQRLFTYFRATAPRT
jgi:hypothetical protein